MARSGIEVEVKFSPASEETLRTLAARERFPGWRTIGRVVENQHNTYYDTASARLEAAGASLRRRLLTDRLEWTYKQGPGPGRDGVARRQEVNSELGLERARDDFPVCPAVTQARTVAGGEPLIALFCLRTLRTQVELARADGTRVALALDRLSLEDEDAGLPYRETEVEVELLRGDERAVAELGLWLMSEYGLLPLRGSKRGRALAWRRGVGLPVVAPDLGASLLAERVVAVESDIVGRPVVVKLAGPVGSARPRALARTLCQAWPGATLVDTDRASIDLQGHGQGGTVIVEGPTVLEAGHADAAAWVKSGLPASLIAHLIASARASGIDLWKLLTAFGEYVVPSQRRHLDPAARWSDLVVIDDGGPDTVTRDASKKLKLYAWPSPEALRAAGAVRLDVRVSRERRYLPPSGEVVAAVDVRLIEDVAIVTFAVGQGMMARAEVRPRVTALLTRLGYRLTQTFEVSHQRYVLGPWELSLDRVTDHGYWCAIERDAGATCDEAPPVAALGLAGARATTASYLDLAAGAETDSSSDG